MAARTFSIHGAGRCRTFFIGALALLCVGISLLLYCMARFELHMVFLTDTLLNHFIAFVVSVLRSASVTSLRESQSVASVRCWRMRAGDNYFILTHFHPNKKIS
jgi:hypothetical protein